MTPRKFIKEIFSICPENQYIEISRIISDPKGEKKGRKRHSVYRPAKDFIRDFDQAMEKIKNINNANYNIYFGACPRIRMRENGKAGRDIDTEVATALWADTDDGKHSRKFVDGSIEALEKLGLGPSIVVETGHGRHFWWLLEKSVPIKDALWAMAGIHTYLQGDNVYNPSRIMRLPGTKNVKDPLNPKDCFISSATCKRYPVEAFDEIKDDPANIGAMDDDFDDDEIDRVNREGDKRIQKILQGVSEGERNTAAAKLAGHYLGKNLSKEETFDALKSWNERNTPPIEESELKSVLDSIAKRESIKNKKKRGGRDHGVAEDFFEGKDFLPMLAAEYIVSKLKIIATPIGRDGLGTNLYVYKDGCYRSGGETRIEIEIRRALGKEATPGRINQVTILIRGISKVDYRDLNKESENLINVKNGMLEWKTGTVLPHNSSYLSTIQINSEYNPDAICPDIEEFLNEIFPEDCINLTEEFLGYLLIPTSKYQKSFVAIGKGGNGKGTFLNLVENLLGSKNVSHISIHEIVEDKFAASNIFGKLANIYHDLEERILQRTGIFKTIVSGDPISAQEKYKNLFDFSPFARLVFSANSFPRSSDRSEAFYDRLIFVNFPNRFRGTKKQIPQYDKILCAKPFAMPYLLNRALQGLRRLEKNLSFSIQESSLEMIEEYRKENSSAYKFIKENCSFEDPTNFMPKKEIYQQYVVWAEEDGLKPISATVFKKVLIGLNVQEARITTSRGWMGISWTEENKNYGIPKNENFGDLGF